MKIIWGLLFISRRNCSV